VDRIYSFQKLPPRLSVSGAITSYPKLEPIAFASVQIKDDNGLDTTITADGKGNFFYRLDLDNNYHFRFFSKNYFAETYDISTFGKKASEEIDAPTALESIIPNIPKIYNKIIFEQKSVGLRKKNTRGIDEVLEMMSKNPQIEIEINSYTDARGVDKDNVDLTQQRADYVRNYLIQKGINGSRISAQGFGETKIINHCTNGITCIDEQHEENNRIEVVITSLDFK
jgi:peptidoglycan-associated lipoprotein